ncbi:MAG TPA: SpoVR family protein [Chthonomonas sp.]|jgi:stage V sporulation protein R|uniref:SpoVR family protein n=1 Tax=Chthonomonas sp. TaxID=2282153 RepID=UPI002B4AC998|nr:SpoVR family protein [Chthonomonas sp.]HLH79601.1 SpoVR family protein [Chthonomonas sp.]
MDRAERAELEKWIDIITQKAAELGLDFYPVHFEVVPDHVIYELGSYGLPARFSHWTFGRDYHIQKTMYEYGMAKIYEIVFNTDPCQAFLLESNSMLAHKFVVAHVLGHNDFFKNNVYFEQTDRKMIEKVRLHSNRIRRYEEEYGPLVVEEFLDAVLSIEYHFDIHATAPFRRKSLDEYEQERRHPARHATEFDDLWVIGEERSLQPAPAPSRRIPPEPDYDLLGFLRDYAPELERWQRDILSMIREEMLYFVPQMRTKIMNEGWASYWHERILSEIDLTPEEHFEFRRMHSAVLSPGSRMSLNPYYVGYTIFKDIERRWNGEPDPDYPETDWRDESLPRPQGEGLKKIFEVRQLECDTSFLRKYLTEGLVKRLDLYTYKQEEINGELVWVVQETDWRKVRDTLLDSMTNFGIPVITVEDGDYQRRGELLLKHHYDGKPLDKDYARRTLRYIYQIWKRPVHIQTGPEGEEMISWDGKEIIEEPA